jgi:hypothetical protein
MNAPIPSILNASVSANIASVFDEPYFDISSLRSFTIHTTGTFVGTIFFEVSNDVSATPQNWVALDQQVTAPGITSVQLGYRFLRIGSSGFVSGTAVIRCFFSANDAPTLFTFDGGALVVSSTAGGSASYNYVRSDDTGVYKYYGFADPTGWQFKRKTLATGVWELSEGLGDFDTNWTDRAIKTYTYF